KYQEREVKHSSLFVRWGSIAPLMITVSSVIFSVVAYQIVSHQSMEPQQETSNNEVITMDRTLNSIQNELEISNVIHRLSPTSRCIFVSFPAISKKDTEIKAFSDSLISSISNPDINVAVYNKHDEIVFTNGNSAPKLKEFAGNQLEEVVNRKKGKMLLTYQKIYSEVNGKLTGYVVVSNSMTYYNSLMSNLLHWMVIISLIAIIIFIAISYIL